MRLFRALAIALGAVLCALPAHADFLFTAGSGNTAVAFDGSHSGTSRCAAANTQCFANVIINSAGTELGTSSNPFQVTGANGTFPASQSGTWTVQPGNTPNTSPWLFSINDGTNTAKVQAASTAAAAGDKSLVTNESPNSQLSVAVGTTADAAATVGSTGTLAAKLRLITTQLDNINTNVGAAVPAGTNLIGNVGLNAVVSGGWTPNHVVAANSNNSTNLKGSGGIVHAVQGYGVGSAPAYIKLYDKATAPTCGTDTPVKVIMIPAAATAANGAGAVSNIIDTQFSSGIGFCIVTGIANNDNTAVAAATFVADLDWK